MTIKLQSANRKIEPPEWTTKPDTHFWYFENEYREQWVAKIDGNQLLLTGLDIGWKEFRLDERQVEQAKEWLSMSIIGGRPGAVSVREVAATVTSKDGPEDEDSLLRIVFNLPEELWLLSIFEIALSELKYRNKKASAM